MKYLNSLKSKTKNQSSAKDHLKYRNYIRDIVLGANDALVSIFALVIGVVGGGLSSYDIFIAGIAGTVAGAISMAIGEYISTKSQEQIYDAEKRREKEHIKHFFEDEKEELKEMYAKKGFSGELLEQIVDTIASDADVMLKVMMEEEFGIKEEERRNPYVAMIFVFIAFLIGSLLPVLPFAFITNATTAGLIATIGSILGLFTVGVIKSHLAETNWIIGGGENALLGLAAGIITFLIGTILTTPIL